MLHKKSQDKCIVVGIIEDSWWLLPKLNVQVSFFFGMIKFFAMLMCKNHLRFDVARRCYSAIAQEETLERQRSEVNRFSSFYKQDEEN